MTKSYPDNPSLAIRPERASDFAGIRSVVQAAFQSAEHSDGNEHDLVERIRKTDAYIPELALVALLDGKVVGHIMLSKIRIGHAQALALAPLSVHPDHQGKGIGKSLIGKAHGKASESGYTCCVVLGSPGYYSKTGYKKASNFGIYAPFDVPDKYYMVFPFGASDIPAGRVSYCEAFGS